MRKHILILLAGSILLLAGCDSGSDDMAIHDLLARYKVSASDVTPPSAGGRTSATRPATQQVQLPDGSGPEEYVRVALERSPYIRRAQYKVLRLANRIPQATSLDDPMVNVAPIGEMAETAAGQEARLDARGDFAPQLGTNASRSIQWSAQPVAAESGGLRMPRMIEQVRQISEFLAERSEGVIRMGEGGVQDNLRLHPAELGGVRVMLSVSTDHTVQTRFIVEQAATAQLIQQHAHELQSILAGHGLSVEQVRVTVQAPGAALPGDTSGWSGQTNGQRRNELDAQNQREESSAGKDPSEQERQDKREA